MSCGRSYSYDFYYRRREEYPRQNQSYPTKSYEKKSESAVNILKQRLVNGEITEEQYHQMLRVLNGEADTIVKELATEIETNTSVRSQPVITLQKNNS